LNLNEKSVDHQLYTSHYKHKSRSRSRSILSRRSSYSSISCDSDENNEIKRTKKLQSVIAKAVDRSSIKCTFFVMCIFIFLSNFLSCHNLSYLFWFNFTLKYF
jgi:hypothetical protein